MLRNFPDSGSEQIHRRGIGVGVKGVPGSDAIVHRRRRNSSQKANAIAPMESWLPGTFPCFAGLRGATIAQSLRNT